MRAGSAELLFVKKLGRHAWRAAWVMLAIQLAATAAGIASLHFVQPKYRSSTTIRVERGQIINPLTRGLAVTSEMEERMRSIREEILSRDYFDKVILRLGLEPPGATPIEHERLVQSMIKSTEISTRQRETFQISYTGTDPKLVRDITNLLSGIFIEDSLANKEGQAGSALEFLQEQLEVYRKKLEESEAALGRYTEQHPDELPSNRGAHLAKVEQLRSSLTDVQNNLRQTRTQRDLLYRQITASESATPAERELGSALVVPNPLVAQIREKEAQLRRLLVDYSESYPDVVALRTEISQLKTELKANPTVPAAQVPTRQPASIQDALGYGQLQQLDSQISALAIREEQIQKDLARFERKVQGIPEVEQELTRLKRDYDVNSEIYNNFLRRVEEARVSRELESSKRGDVFRILQAAALPLSPVKPTPLQVVLVGVAGGLGLNALLLYVLALLDTSFQSTADVQTVLGLKVMVSVPRYVSPRQRSLTVMKTTLLSTAVAVYAAGVAAFLMLKGAL